MMARAGGPTHARDPMRRSTVLLLTLVFTACPRKSDPEPDELVTVVVAGEDLAAGSELRLESIAQRRVPAKFVTANTLRPEGATEALKRATLIALKNGDPILLSALGPDVKDVAFSDRVDDTWRGLWVSVDAPVPLSESLRRGDHVDVLATFKDPQSGEFVTNTLEQNVVVLAVRAKAVAFRLDPQQVKRVIEMAELGQVRVSVRSAADAAQVDGGAVGVDSIVPPSRPRH